MNNSTNSIEPVIFVLDDDEPCGTAIAEMVRTFGYDVQAFHSSRQFLETIEKLSPDQAGCLVTDLRMPGADGMEVLQRILERGGAISVIIVSAYANAALTMRALRTGAVAVLEKPFREDELWTFIQEGLAKSEEAVARNRRQRDLEQRFTRLAPQDRQVLQLILEGCKNRTMAKKLEVSLRTIENRRRRVFDIMQAESVAELARMVVEFEHKLPPTAPADETWRSLPFFRVA